MNDKRFYTKTLGEFSFSTKKCLIGDPMVSFGTNERTTLKDPMSQLNEDDKQKCIYLNNIDNSSPWTVFLEIDLAKNAPRELSIMANNFMDNIETVEFSDYCWKIDYGNFYAANQDLGIFDFLYYDDDDFVRQQFPEIVDEMEYKSCPWYNYIQDFAKMADDQFNTQVFSFGVFGDFSCTIELVLFSVDVLFNKVNEIIGIKINLGEGIADETADENADETTQNADETTQTADETTLSETTMSENIDWPFDQDLTFNEEDYPSDDNDSAWKSDDDPYKAYDRWNPEETPTKTVHELSKILKPKTPIKGYEWKTPPYIKNWTMPPKRNQIEFSPLERLTNPQAFVQYEETQVEKAIAESLEVAEKQELELAENDIINWVLKDQNKTTVNKKNVKEI